MLSNNVIDQVSELAGARLHTAGGTLLESEQQPGHSTVRKSSKTDFTGCGDRRRRPTKPFFDSDRISGCLMGPSIASDALPRQ
ncbi:hypothetical protein CH263_08590 [Rhodococcus sp. 06-1059B-a]|nr:hypothetical protein CH263_08590 [Rhodococcus sp. 06-1059B-a]